MTLCRIALALLAAIAAGCGKDSGSGNPKAHAPASGAPEDPFAALGTEDARLARAQRTCPVSSDELGAMGTPVKIIVKDRTVFLCCEGCREKILADPDTYLAKLGK
jgi:hypothetical protein